VVPTEFSNFFVASASAGAALLGLLFVAVSIASERTVAVTASIQRRGGSTSVFSAFLNVFFLSLTALIPGINVAPALVIMAFLSLTMTIHVTVSLTRDNAGWANARQNAGIVSLSFVAYGMELYEGIVLLLNPTAEGAVTVIASLIVGVYFLGIVRSWELIGAQRFGFLSGFSPLRESSPSERKPSIVAKQTTD